jgi:hypothetical protein
VADITVTGTGATPPASLSVYRCTTELEAVNVMLGTIGEQPVNSLDISTVSEVSIASDILFDVSREVQTRGYSWNKEFEYPLALSGGEIPLPANCIDVNVTDPTDIWCVQRGIRLYNRTDHTYVFTADVEATIIFFLPFTDLPQAARNFITLRSARKFQVRILGSEAIEKFTEIDENQAWLTLCAKEVDQGMYNMKNSMDPRLSENRGLGSGYGSLNMGLR